jgi:hypothetical protein
LTHGVKRGLSSAAARFYIPRGTPGLALSRVQTGLAASEQAAAQLGRRLQQSTPGDFDVLTIDIGQRLGFYAAALDRGGPQSVAELARGANGQHGQGKP